MLVAPAPVRQVAARDHELGVDAVGEAAQRVEEQVVVPRPEVEVRDVQEARRHRRSRLYSD
jgi:hypothetical protein